MTLARSCLSKSPPDEKTRRRRLRIKVHFDEFGNVDDESTRRASDSDEERFAEELRHTPPRKVMLGPAAVNRMVEPPAPQSPLAVRALPTVDLDLRPQIFRALRAHVGRHASISARAIDVVNTLLVRLVSHFVLLVQREATLHDVGTLVVAQSGLVLRELLVDDVLADEALRAAMEAVLRFNDGVLRSSSDGDFDARAFTKLKFPVGRITNELRSHCDPYCRLTNAACVLFVAALEHVAMVLLQLAAAEVATLAHEADRLRIEPTHLSVAIASHACLRRVAKRHGVTATPPPPLPDVATASHPTPVPAVK